MKKLLLMIPLLSVIGLMSSCGLLGNEKHDYLDAYIKVSHLIRDTIVILDPQNLGDYEFYIEHYDGGVDSITVNMDYNQDRIVQNKPLYVHYKKEWKAIKLPTEWWAKIKIDGDPLDVTYTFWFPSKNATGELPDGTKSDFIKVYWDTSEKPNAEDKVILKSKIWFQYKK